jgi:hypothetical protein
MNRALILILAAVAALSACQKQQTEEERKAEIEREVQSRLAAEQQAQQQEQLAQRQRDLDAREKALAQSQPSVTNEQPISTPRQDRERIESESERGPVASYNLFYTRLEPYGSWLETRDYGYVWQPRETGSSSWRPYLNGHWVYTDAGWTWVSEEPFGWATYHYGRWARLRNVGWVWVPGDEWGPAWVSWRKGDDYVGWAPLPPEAQFDRRSGIHNWADNYYDIGPAQYCFVPTARLGSARVEQTVMPTEQNITIINRTTNVTNITYNNVMVVNQGPNYEELRSRAEQPIPRLKLERQVAVDLNTQPHEPIVRGETIQMVAPAVRRAQAVERPREVRQNVTEATVDRGWAEIGDTEAARQARAKMQSEATPPADAPPKIVGRTSSAATTGSSATTSATATSEGRGSPATPSITPERGTRPSHSIGERSARASSATPSSTAAATAGATRPRQTGTPTGATPTPRASATASPRASAAARTASPTPEASADNEPPRVGGRLKSQAKRFNPARIEPMSPNGPAGSPSTASPALTPKPAQSPPPNPNESGASSIRPRPEGVRRRPAFPSGGQRAGSPGETTPTPAATATVSPSPVPNER